MGKGFLAFYLGIMLILQHSDTHILRYMFVISPFVQGHHLKSVFI